MKWKQAQTQMEIEKMIKTIYTQVGKMIISWCLQKCICCLEKTKRRWVTTGFQLTELTKIMGSIYKHEVKMAIWSRTENLKWKQKIQKTNKKSNEKRQGKKWAVQQKINEAQAYK